MMPARPRPSLPVLLLAAPAILAAVALVVAEGRWWMGEADSTSRSRPEGTLAEALREGDLERAFAFIDAGQDPNVPVALRDDELTGGEEIMVTPLLIAVAYNRDDSVAMLMSVGARLDAPGNRFAVCLANRLGHEEIAEAIVRDGALDASKVVCPERTSAEAPLAAYVE